MPLYMEDVLATDPNRRTDSATEYRTRYMSPRREDYAPHIVLPRISTNRPVSRSRSFLSYDVDPNSTSTASEYRLRFPNHHPKRPYVFHAQPSHVFDFVPMPVNSRVSPRVDLSPSFTKDTEYHERFPNYRSYVPIQELVPPHLPAQPNMPSATQVKRDRMTRSQYFHELVTDSDKYNGGQRYVGNSEQRTAFQWPYHMQQQQQQQQQSTPYSTMNMYNPIPPIYREVLNASN
ncbi:unnamed protein product [Rotaria sp. Silwood2]|nr:unnamed protein product [Rotaria sp. Silwood2]CAF2820340.1 unnamed protein product [Rotaria sp. Silwood2]CAF3097793.1 unnamed protein product [Rotaria sp. Silwood2]CAF3240930.1 unnamed protein product [Rotaria sp. Silwood2]CAF4313922.1 unnamed protein product [Rotaria sp. Silwood2]